MKVVYKGQEETSPSPSFGGGKEENYKWVVPNGEHIVKIIYRYTLWIESLIFVTDKGTESPRFGGDGGYGPFTFILPDKAALNGFFAWRDYYIRGIGFSYFGTYDDNNTLRTTRKTKVYGDYNKGKKF